MTIEAVDTRARGLRNRREAEALGLGGVLRRLDWVLMFALVGVVGYGLSAIDGITKHDIGGSAVSRQGLYAGAGALLFVIVLFIDPDTYRRLRRPIYFGALGLMVFVLAAGAATRGSHRWINVGFFTFQPSEFGKVLFVLVVAGFLADRSRTITSAGTALAAIGYGLVPIALVFVQPDIGTALVYMAALAAVLFVAGVRWSQLAVLLALTVACSLVRPLGAARGRRQRAQALSGGTPDRVHASEHRSAGCDVQPAPVDHRRRRGRTARPRASSARPRRVSTTCPSTRRTSRSHPWPRNGASSVLRFCCSSTCSSSGER